MTTSQPGFATFADHLTVADAAEYLGISANTLRAWDQNGKLRAKRHPMNQYRLYDRRELDQLLQQLQKVSE